MATYKIKWGDTLWGIANKYGTTVDELVKLNSIKNPNLIYAGNILNLPDYGEKAQTEKNQTAAQDKALKAEEKPGEFTQSQNAINAKNKLESLENAKPPEYTSKYADLVSSLYDKFISQSDKPYSLKGDPLYYQYRDIYTNNAKKASENALAAALELSGGNNSSFALTAANQAYGENIKGLTENIPELYDAARKRKESDAAALLNKIEAVNELEKAEYDKWRDSIDDYYTDLNYYYTKYNNLSKAEYEKYLDNIELWLKDRSYYYKKLLDAQDQKNKEKELEYKWAKL